jgi:hypothetical protein
MADTPTLPAVPPPWRERPGVLGVRAYLAAPPARPPPATPPEPYPAARAQSPRAARPTQRRSRKPPPAILDPPTMKPTGGSRGRLEHRDDEPCPPGTFPSQGSLPGAAAPSGSGWPPWLSAASPLAVVSLLGEHAKGIPVVYSPFFPLTRASRPSGCRRRHPPEPPGSPWPRCVPCPREEEDRATLRMTPCEKVNFPYLCLCLANLAETPQIY